MSGDDFRSARDRSRSAGQYGERSSAGQGRRTELSDESAHDDGRLPTFRYADRQAADRGNEESRERALITESEGGLAAFLADAYVVTDADGIIQDANPAASELFGTRHPALRGIPLADLLVPSDRASFRAHLRRLAASDAPVSQATWLLRLRTASGGAMEASVRARAVRGDSGATSFVRWLMRPAADAELAAASRAGPDDLSTSIRARHTSRHSRIVAEASALLARSFDLDVTLTAMARLALPALGDHCWVDIVEYDGGISRLHITRSADVGASRDPVLATAPSPHDPSNLVVSVLESGAPVLDAALTLDRLHELAAGEEQFAALRKLRAKSVLSVPMMARGRVLGALTFIVAGPHRSHRGDDMALAEDLAQRAGLATDNARLYAMAQGASRAKDEFMASMSHELRTPLTAIIGYTELLGDEIVGPLNATQREQLSRIRSSGNLLLALVDQILDLARVDTGKEEPRMAEVSAAAVVDQVVMLSANQVRQKNLALTVKAPPPDVELVTDPLWLRQILVNLLGNAVKFTERGEVGISAAREGDRVYFEVWDTGIGISVKHLERIFDPFWQVEQRMTRRYGGAGVGLAVARRLCALLGGDIAVASTLDAGSRFVVSLPTTPGH